MLNLGVKEKERKVAHRMNEEKVTEARQWEIRTKETTYNKEQK
jgi:hypothetical protein